MLEDSRLRFFAVLVEEGSFTKAARRLRVSQPAVSQSISELEKQLGVKLFERTRSAAILTREGESFRSYAEEILRWYAAAEAMFGMEGKATVRRPVGIRCPALAAECILPKILKDPLNLTADTFTVRVIPDEEADKAKDDITLFTLPRKDTLDFEDASTFAGVLSAAMAGNAEDTGSAKIAVWAPYERTLDKELLSRTVFSSDSPTAVLKVAESVPGTVAVVPHIAAASSELPLLPYPLPRLQTDLHIRFGDRIAGTALAGVLQRKLFTIIQ